MNVWNSSSQINQPTKNIQPIKAFNIQKAIKKTFNVKQHSTEHTKNTHSIKGFKRMKLIQTIKSIQPFKNIQPQNIIRRFWAIIVGNFFRIPFVEVFTFLAQKILLYLLCHMKDIIDVTSWCSGYHYCTTPEVRFCACLWHVEDSRWWGFLTMVPAENKGKRLSSFSHTKNNNNHHHHHHHHHQSWLLFWKKKKGAASVLNGFIKGS